MKKTVFRGPSARTLLGFILAMSSMALCQLAKAEERAGSAPQANPSATDAALVQTTVNSPKAFDPASSSPIYMEFEGSTTLSGLLAERAKAAGFLVSATALEARTVVLVEGTLSLHGGPKYYRGIKFPLGAVSERALAEHDGKRSSTAGEIGGAVMLAIGSQLATSAAGVGFGVSNLAVIIGDMTGARGWMNTKLTGDPRGWCIQKCEDWNKVTQIVDIKVTWEVGGQKQSANVASTAFSEAILADALVSSAVKRVLVMFEQEGKDDQVAMTPLN